MRKRALAVSLAILAASLCGVGSAWAFLVGGAAVSASGQADEALLLDWGETEFLPLEGVVSGPQTTQVDVKVMKTSEAPAIGKLRLYLRKPQTTLGNWSCAGLKIEVADLPFDQASDDQIEALEVTGSIDDPVFPEQPLEYSLSEDQTFYVRASVSAEYVDNYSSGLYQLQGELICSCSIEEA